ncbi:MAG: HTTM domain-containing protein [Crocinitomicaceae bacterium]
MNKIIQHFISPFGQIEKVEFFRKALYLFLFLNTLTLLPIAHDLFGYYGVIGTRGWNTNISFLNQGSYGLINLLSHPANSHYSWVYILFILGQMSFLILGLIGKWPRLSSFMVYFFTVNLFMKGYLAFTGGEVLVNFMLFYLMFVHPPKKEGVGGELQNILNQAFYKIMLIQVCLVYFFSALYKLYDAPWVEGKALMYISRIDGYSTLPFEWLFAENPTLSMFATYATLAYMILFPFIVWVKKIKTPFLMIGLIFHIGISFGMGIFSFGVIMILMYILFLDKEQIQTIKEKIKRRVPNRVIGIFSRQ